MTLVDNSDPVLDPHSDKFNAKKWVKHTMNEISKREGANVIRKGGAAWRNLTAIGEASGSSYQLTVGNAIPSFFASLFSKIRGHAETVDILKSFDGYLESGEMLVVLGPPGSGCSTLLKTLSGETHGFQVSKDAHINYNGIDAKEMHETFRGEAIYCAEVERNFPILTVGQTLQFAAEARLPVKTPGQKRTEVATHVRDVIMAMFGIAHTVNTKVGDDLMRGVSGGERKRVSIAEVALAGAPFGCWDNSTRGLDSANAIEFCKTLRLFSETTGASNAVAIYQAPGSAYDVFDKATVLYDGECIYFGPATEARQYFVDLGFEPPEQQSTPDFLTSMTAPKQRTPRKGMESKVPKTAVEFAKCWRSSEKYKRLLGEIEQYEQRHPIGGDDRQAFVDSRKEQKAKRSRQKSPYTLSYGGQVALCLKRGFWRLKADPFLTVFQLLSNTIIALIITSVFYNLQPVSSSMQSRSALLFFAVLISAFGSALEMLTLYAQRPIVEKHQRYAFYHPSAEAIASMLTDLPYKVVNAICFSLTLYFMSHLRREPGPYFFFLFVSFLITLTMSMFFRSIASLSRSLIQALTPAAVIILALVLYSGFAIPTTYMRGWISWVRYLNPVYFAFEAMMINEFAGRTFECDTIVPSGPGYPANAANAACSVVGSQPGSLAVPGTNYLIESYGYFPSHRWRNIGILFAFLFGLLAIYITAAEFVSEKKSKGEVLLWPRSALKKQKKEGQRPDEENQQRNTSRTSSDTATNEQAVEALKQTSIFHWKDLTYTVPIKDEKRVILNKVNGWVKPGTLTALMGVSGAGKTTLLDVCASRVRTGVVEGDLLVDGRPRDLSFQRKTGYVQQQDLHLPTSTVREALSFSALLRQPASVSREDKLAYVEEVLVLLEMEAYADAVVGVMGEGLNVEQRKRLTIGVELAAKPELLLFVDEPTSGLDSDTSWSIIQLLKKLAANGMSILCTIHQPSALLFAEFDRLLFLAKGGKTIYFGEVGKESKILRDYFERNGAKECPAGANPAEWMLEIIGAAPGTHTDIDWHDTWNNSPEYKKTREHLEELENLKNTKEQKEEDPSFYKEYAATTKTQLVEVTRRAFQQYLRTPSYIYSKFALVSLVGLFIGFSFINADTSTQGLQSQLLSVFMIFTVFGQLIQQSMPLFVSARGLYEVREAPSRTFSWKIFMASQAIVDLPWNIIASVLLFFTFYYPIGLYQNAEPTNSVNERGVQFWIFVLLFLLFSQSFGLLAIAAIDTAEGGSNVANTIFSLSLIFCGVLAQPQNSSYWLFVWYMTPFHYFAEGLLTTALKDTAIVCADNEVLSFNAPGGQTCGEYLQPYISGAGGYLVDAASGTCQFCPLSETNTFLRQLRFYPERGWQDVGVIMVYIVFNFVAATCLYYFARVPKKPKNKKSEKETAKNQTKAEKSG